MGTELFGLAAGDARSLLIELEGRQFHVELGQPIAAHSSARRAAPTSLRTSQGVATTLFPLRAKDKGQARGQTFLGTRKLDLMAKMFAEARRRG